MIHRGITSGHELSRIVGKWTWAALPTRPILSVFSSVYKFIQVMNRRPAKLWPSVINELKLMCGLAPLMFTNITAGWLSHVAAVDASMVGQGMTSQRISSDDAKVLSGTAGCVTTTDVPVRNTIINGNWRKCVSYGWRHGGEHINVLEARALLTAVRWSLSLPRSGRSRFVVLSDSSVVVHSISKGRSSSPRLLPRLRTIASLLLASATHLYVHWVPSEQNPADGLSRLL